MNTFLPHDQAIADLLVREDARQTDQLTLIPSENHVSREVLTALSSVFSDKYAEGYPGARYYPGNTNADTLESLVRDRACALFGVAYANVQPYSGSPANFAVTLACAAPGSVIMGLDLLSGGHLTHGWKFSATALFWKSIPYHLTSDGAFDIAELERLAQENKPTIIWAGGTAIPRTIPWAEFARVADSVGAYLVADISHIAGLVVGGAHPSPVPYAHIVTTTTHKTLRGPRGGMIMVTEKGITKDADLPKKIDKAIIPGLQGGPHLNTIAGIGIALHEAATPAFQEYAARIVKNAKAFATALIARDMTLASGGTDNHLLLLDLSKDGVSRGKLLQNALECAGIIANMNMVPGDAGTPLAPSGVRLGTPAVTTRGMNEKEMEQIADWIARVRTAVAHLAVPIDKEERKLFTASLPKTLEEIAELKIIRQEVQTLARQFPLPAFYGTD